MTERSKLGLLIRAAEVRHESQNVGVIVLSFSYEMFVHWRAPVLQPTGPFFLPMSRGCAAAWTVPDPPSPAGCQDSWGSGPARARRDLGVSTTEAPVLCLPLIAPV